MAFDPKAWAARQAAPVTVALLVTLVGTALLGWLTQGRSTLPLMLVGDQLWGLLTYPWAYSPLASSFGLIFLLFSMMWLVTYGGAVERDVSTPRFVVFWLLATLLPGIVALVLRLPLAGPWLPIAALVVAWCARNRGAGLNFWGIPLSSPVLAAIVAATVVFSYGAANPLFGLFMALPLALAWAFGGDLLPIPYSGSSFKKRDQPVVKGGTVYDGKYFEDVKAREIEREEQERLRRLFEGK